MKEELSAWPLLGIHPVHLWCTFAKSNTWSEFCTCSIVYIHRLHLYMIYFKRNFPNFYQKALLSDWHMSRSEKLKRNEPSKKQRRKHILQGIHQEYSITINFYLSKRAKTRFNLKKDDDVFFIQKNSFIIRITIKRKRFLTFFRIPKALLLCIMFWDAYSVEALFWLSNQAAIRKSYIRPLQVPPIVSHFHFCFTCEGKRFAKPHNVLIMFYCWTLRC